MTVRRWCAAGLLPGAVRLGSANRGTWVVPESALEGFEPPKERRERKAAQRA